MSFDPFHLFPKLPIELRLMIWRLAVPSPRLVHLAWSADDSKWLVREDAAEQYGWGVLLANKESNEAIPEECLPLIPFSTLTTSQTPKTSYISPAVDFVQIDSDPAFIDHLRYHDGFDKEELSRMQNIFYAFKTRLYRHEISLLYRCCSLRNLVCTSRSDRSLPWDISAISFETRPSSGETIRPEDLASWRIQRPDGPEYEAYRVHDKLQPMPYYLHPGETYKMAAQRTGKAAMHCPSRTFELKDGWRDKEGYLLHFQVELREGYD